MTLKEGKGEGERETGVLLLCWMSRREEVYGQEEDEQLPLRRREGRAGARTATGAGLDDVLLCPLTLPLCSLFSVISYSQLAPGHLQLAGSLIRQADARRRPIEAAGGRSLRQNKKRSTRNGLACLSSFSISISSLSVLVLFPLL